MNLKNIILSSVVASFLFSCYEDLGNYTYKDINEIAVSGIDARYERDSEDSLNIYPKIEGTQFSDTSKFSYQWEIDRTVRATTHDLRYVVNLLPGEKMARFIVTDKATGWKKYHRFALKVSSSTAADLIMVLSKYNGKAELSYLRLDRPSNFAVNYYESRFGQPLGVKPQQLHIRLCEAKQNVSFSNLYGKVMVLADDEIKLIDKRTLMPDTINVKLTGESYTGLVSYPKPDIEGYKSEYIVDEGFTIWREGAYGLQLQTYFYEVSNGALYHASNANSTWTASYGIKGKSPYNEGKLSPFAFFDAMEPTPHKGVLKNAGYDVGNLVVFDERVGRFAFSTSGVSVTEVKTSRVKDFPGYGLVYGAATSKPDNTFLAVLRNGGTHKFLLMNRKAESTSTESDKNNIYSILAEMTLTSSVITDKTTFYTTIRSPYIIFSTGDKIYRYNMDNIQKNQAPDERDIIGKLSDYGYDGNAVITDICMSRTEKTLLVGVSRYGSDTEATSEELKGDLLWFDIGSATFDITYNASKSHKGISGIPVDVKFKYQTHLREGKSRLTDETIDQF